MPDVCFLCWNNPIIPRQTCSQAPLLRGMKNIRRRTEHVHSPEMSANTHMVVPLVCRSFNNVTVIFFFFFFRPVTLQRISGHRRWMDVNGLKWCIYFIRRMSIFFFLWIYIFEETSHTSVEDQHHLSCCCRQLPVTGAPSSSCSLVASSSSRSAGATVCFSVLRWNHSILTKALKTQRFIVIYLFYYYYYC